MAKRQRQISGTADGGVAASPPERVGDVAGAGVAEGMILLGRITGAQGLKGEVRITTFTETPENIAAYGPLTGSNGQLLHVEDLRLLKGGAVAARLAGVTDRTAAEALRGVALYVARESLPAPDDNEWYYDDLIGLRVVSPDGGEIGEVVAVQNYGAGDLLEIRKASECQTLLVAFTEAAVPIVDIAAGRMVVRLPDEIEA
jgi:16S rRNA processing protein RimM